MQRVKRVSNFIVGGVFFFLFFISCQRGEVYFKYDSLPFKGWGMNDSLFFHPVITDSSAFYDVFIEVRNDNRYAYQNLWLYVTDDFSGDSLYTTRPFEISLADDFGKWKGRGFSFLYGLEVIYLENVQFSHGGERFLSICHGMRDSSLTGIRDIGVRIVKRE